MTVDNEFTKLENYKKLEFVEFLELLCRIADLHFDQEPSYASHTLVQRLQIVVSNVLALKGI